MALYLSFVGHRACPGMDCFCDLAGICLFGRFGFFGFVLVFVFSFRVFLVLRGLGEHKIGWIRR